MVTWVDGKGSTIEQLKTAIRKAEQSNQKELASMLRTCLQIREANEAIESNAKNINRSAKALS